MREGLNPRQQKFVNEYLVDLNAKQALIRAGYSAKGTSAEVTASKLLRNTKVAAEIAKLRAVLSEKTGITQERVLREYEKLAFYDPRKLFDDAGYPVHVSQLDDNTAAAVAGFDVVSQGNSETGVATVLKVKLADKKGALDSVARHLGMFKDSLNLTVTDALAERLSRAKKRG